MTDTTDTNAATGEQSPLNHALSLGYGIGEIQDMLDRGTIKMDDLLLLKQPRSESGDNYTPPQGTPQLNIIRMADVQIETVDWLWYPYIPLGKVTILQGDPGLGKTFVATRIASIVTTGGAFPDGSDMTAIKPGNVIFQTAEDGLGDTIKARLLDAGADCERVFVIDESQESLTLGDARLTEAVKLLLPKLIVIDPLQAYLGAGVDMHRANEVRPVMSRLDTLAAKYRCAIVLIGHLNKATGGKSIYRGLGSIDISAAARSVLAVGEVPNEKYRRAIVQTKSSLAPAGQTVLFDLDPARGFLWAGVSDLTADDILNHHPQTTREAPERDECVEFLKELLSAGPIPASEVFEASDANGYSMKTLERAKKKAGVCSFKEKGKNGLWYWNLKERHTKTHDELDDVDDVTGKERQDRQHRQVNMCDVLTENTIRKGLI